MPDSAPPTESPPHGESQPFACGEGSQVDPEKLADLVYRLMLQEIRVERARRGRLSDRRGF